MTHLLIPLICCFLPFATSSHSMWLVCCSLSFDMTHLPPPLISSSVCCSSCLPLPLIWCDLFVTSSCSILIDVTCLTLLSLDAPSHLMLPLIQCNLFATSSHCHFLSFSANHLHFLLFNTRVICCLLSFNTSSHYMWLICHFLPIATLSCLMWLICLTLIQQFLSFNVTCLSLPLMQCDLFATSSHFIQIIWHFVLFVTSSHVMPLVCCLLLFNTSSHIMWLLCCFLLFDTSSPQCNSLLLTLTWPHKSFATSCLTIIFHSAKNECTIQGTVSAKWKTRVLCWYYIHNYFFSAKYSMQGSFKVVYILCIFWFFGATVLNVLEGSPTGIQYCLSIFIFGNVLSDLSNCAKSLMLTIWKVIP